MQAPQGRQDQQNSKEKSVSQSKRTKPDKEKMVRRERMGKAYEISTARARSSLETCEARMMISGALGQLGATPRNRRPGKGRGCRVQTTKAQGVFFLCLMQVACSQRVQHRTHIICRSALCSCRDDVFLFFSFSVHIPLLLD